MEHTLKKLSLFFSIDLCLEKIAKPQSRTKLVEKNANCAYRFVVVVVVLQLHRCKMYTFHLHSDLIDLQIFSPETEQI